MEIEIKYRYESKILISGEYNNIKDCLEKNRSADLRSADLRGADLGGAYLGGAKNYKNIHQIAIEIAKRQPLEYFTEKEWSFIGKIAIHFFCWDKIKEIGGKTALSIFKKLAKLGFNEYLDYYKKGEA